MLVDASYTRLAAGLFLVFGLLFWTGCDSSGGLSDSPEGAFTLRLTDAPADLDSAVVTVDRVDLLTEDGESDDDDEGEGDDDGVITLTDESRTLDLLQLQNGNEALLADGVTVPEGEYTQLRFVLGDENYAIVNGERQDLSVPSAQQTGIKIVLPGEVEVESDGDELDVTLDFDVEDSFIDQGDGTYRFAPTIKVQNVFVNGESIETVSVAGLVTGEADNSGTLAVEDVPFTTTSATEIEGDDVSSVEDFTENQAVKVEGTVLDDGTLEAREIEADDLDDDRSITARLESKDETDGAQSVTLLGVTIQVTNDTEFDDEDFGSLQAGDRLEVDYVVNSDGEKIATEIENEDD